MNHFHFVAFPSFSILTSFLQDLQPQDHLLECGQIQNGEYTLFFESEKKHQRPQNATDFFVTDRPTKTWLQAYHKQLHVPLTHGLLLVESTKLSNIFFFLESKPELEAHLLEITRTALPGGLAQATFVNVGSFDTKSTQLAATFHAKPSKQLQSLYSF